MAKGTRSRRMPLWKWGAAAAGAWLLAVSWHLQKSDESDRRASAQPRMRSLRGSHGTGNYDHTLSSGAHGSLSGRHSGGSLGHAGYGSLS